MTTNCTLLKKLQMTDVQVTVTKTVFSHLFIARGYTFVYIINWADLHDTKGYCFLCAAKSDIINVNISIYLEESTK